MNINCIICSDLFSPHSDIDATSCGHLFHCHCLAQWIERSKTCPQCRHAESESTVHRVFFNIPSSEDVQDDVVSLQAKVDNAKFQLSLRDKDIANFQSKITDWMTKEVALKQIAKTLKEANRAQEAKLKNTKQQLIYFKDRVTESDKLQAEIARLKGEISSIGYLRTVINGCEDEVGDILSVCTNPHTLCMFIAVLKRELIEADKEKQKLTGELHSDKNELRKKQTDLSGLEVEMCDLQKSLSEHEKCPAVIAELKSKLAEYLEQHKDDDANQSVNRAIFESPAPQRPDFDQAFVDNIAKDSPTIEERVKEIKSAHSPYLAVRGYGSSIANLMQAKFTVKNQQTAKMQPILDKYSIYHQQIASNHSDCNYNGLGGHSKDDIFPQPKKATSKVETQCLKRPKSSNSMPLSKKMKKLAPLKKSK